MSGQGTTRATASARIAEWLDQHSSLLIWGSLALTALLIIPLAVMDTPDAASQNPAGRVFDLQQRIDDTFATPAHFVPFLAESESGDILTAESLSELLLSEIGLRTADSRRELTPEDIADQEFLLRYFDNSTSQSVVGVITIADAVEVYFQTSTGGAVSLIDATEEQVKVAIHRVLADPTTEQLVESFSTKAVSESRVVNGEEIIWWTSPALQFNVIADNERLGGGTQAIGVSADDRTLGKERFNRNVQEVLRSDVNSYRVWGIAIDANLESADQGQESGIFITFTVIAAIVIVGITLRSYWAVALTGVGLGVLMIWLKGISLLVGLKSGLVIDLIVPIAMVSLGVDFAVHAVRRYQEERKKITVPRRALVIGLGGLLPALTLAVVSDGIAFLSNASAGIEAVVHFGLAAGIATASSFLVLGIVLPFAYARIDGLLTGRSYRSRGARANIIFSSFGAASAAGGAVILLVAVSPLAGAAFLAITLVFSVLLPVLYLRLRPAKQTPETGTGEEAALTRAIGVGLAAPDSGAHTGAHTGAPHAIDRLAALTRYRYVLLVAVAAITALAAIAALRLYATFDVKDFFAADADFTVSLDKLDEHVGERSGEAASILIEGDLTDLGALSAVQAVFDNLDGNDTLGRDSRGVVTISEPNILQIVLDITASQEGRDGVLALTGIEISEDAPYGFPKTPEQVGAVLDYAVQAGVPSGGGELAYTPGDVRSVLLHNPLGRSLDLTHFSVFLPGTREQSAVVRARDSIDENLRSLDSSPAITSYGLTGSPLIRQAQLEATTRSLQTSIPIAAGAAFVLLLVAFRSIRFAIVTIIPIGLVVVWLYAIMQVSGFALNFVTATIGAVSIGVGIDFSIHLTERFREELGRSETRLAAMTQALRGTGVALAGSAGSSIVGFAIMGLAPMPLFSSYGYLTSIMVFLAVLAALVVLPSLLLIATPELRVATSKPSSKPTAEGAQAT
ncbi:MAG: MMPL family transporter [Chloroflexi bacterium]|nr:MMPL family transporter [Chloroflexota bacterium]